MGKDALILDLAKLVISAAWADGELSNDEINALKDLLFSIDEIKAEDWTVLEMYIESPTSEDESAELLERVTTAIRNNADKAFAIETLEKLFNCDGKITPEEQRLMEELKGDISSVSTGIFSGITSAFKSAIGQRSAAVRQSCLREGQSDDYVKNTIYYDLMRRQKESSVTIDRPDSEVRKLCLATGLLSHLAYIDEKVTPEEKEAMKSILIADWELSKEQADLFASIACDRITKVLDYFRLSHGFFKCTNYEERRRFLATLFKMANAVNKTDNDEIEEVRKIAADLKLSHKDFIDAKLTIPREDRRGL